MAKKTIPVSVIIPCYRCANTLERALCSIEKQTVLPEEVVLISDGNAQETLRAIETICRSFDNAPFEINLIRLEQNRGPGFARNIGWELTRGDYLVFLDADDAWHPTKLALQYHWMTERPDVVLSGHPTLEITCEADANGLDLPENWRSCSVGPLMQLLSNRFHTRSVMVKRDIAFRFATTRRHSEDYQLWSEIILSGMPAWRLEIPLAFTFKAQYGASGLSGNLWLMEKGEIASYYQLYRQGLISAFTFMALLPFSLVKFCRRIVISTLARTDVDR